MIDAGADSIGDPSQGHMVAIDARSPLYDGGICTRIDCVHWGVVVNREAKRFYDEGEDFCPSGYRHLGRTGRAAARADGLSIIDQKPLGRFMPPVFSWNHRRVVAGTRAKAGPGRGDFVQTIADYNAACRVGNFDHTALDDCHTEGLSPAKTHWARPIDTAPFYAIR